MGLTRASGRVVGTTFGPLEAGWEVVVVAEEEVS